MPILRVTRTVDNHDFASVSGGAGNIAGPGTLPVNLVLSPGQAVSVSGGRLNTATGAAASISGGTSNSGSGSNEWHSGKSAGFPTGTEY